MDDIACVVVIIKNDYDSQPTPSPSQSKPCGSDPDTVNLFPTNNTYLGHIKLIPVDRAITGNT